MIEPLRLNLTVSCPVAHAFAVWTDQISRWWPADHTVSGRADAEVVLEPHPGGRIFERTPEGVEHEWGEVTHWEPPRRLGYLWHLRRDRADATIVDIQFTAAGDDTQIEITHTGWERLGTEGPTWRDRNQSGWTTLLPHFARAVETEEETSCRQEPRTIRGS
jgi:uncharacterized protein YndB with AHSA1/START domain